MFQLENEQLNNHDSEGIIIGLFEDQKQNQAHYVQVNDLLEEHLDDLVKSGDVSYSYGTVSKVHTFGKIKAKRLYFVGLGKKDDLTVAKFRKAMGKTFKQVSKDGLEKVSVQLGSVIPNEQKEDYYEALGEAFSLATYQLETYHTDRKEKKVLSKVTLLSEQNDTILEKVNVGLALGHGANVARYLVNLPGNLLTASDLASYAENIADKHKLEIEVFGKEEIEQLGMGALLAVNQGSDEPPRFIVMKYQGKEKWEKPVALVGKGITFDTGGYSIKPKDGIVGMKMDMGGAAAVIGAMDIIGELKPEENVIALIPSTDNMISGKAFKPDDVIVSLSGKTIEIRNTDAEGRLALADAVTYARQQGASKIIDVATLTGGVIVALGNWVTGAMTNDEEWFKQVKEASDAVDEPIWQLPYFDVYKETVRKSDIADLNNSPGRAAHPIMAGAFVGDFAEDTPWVHLDIAGTALSDSEHDLGPKGPTGVMARTLAKTILNG
ncbi:leucyl aminopeptidase [Bacillaceae bacterium W0354]